MEKIGDRIKKERERKGLKQSDLAAAIKKSTATITHIENNEHNGTFEILRILSEKLEVSADYLLTGKNTENIEINQEGIRELEKYKEYLKERYPIEKKEIKKVGNL